MRTVVQTTIRQIRRAYRQQREMPYRNRPRSESGCHSKILMNRKSTRTTMRIIAEWRFLSASAIAKKPVRLSLSCPVSGKQ